MTYVYVLQSRSSKRLYIGTTNDIKRRITEHNDGRSRSTKPYRPWWIVHIEKYPTVEKARRRETFLKKKKSASFLFRYVISPDVPNPAKTDFGSRDPDRQNGASGP